MPTKSTMPCTDDAESQRACAGDNEYVLLVMNTEIGLTGTVSITAFNEDEAVRVYERDNPACTVISVLKAGD